MGGPTKQVSFLPFALGDCVLIGLALGLYSLNQVPPFPLIDAIGWWRLVINKQEATVCGVNGALEMTPLMILHDSYHYTRALKHATSRAHSTLD